ncbi:histone-like nucleoid-structuring protein Lsr2 [Amycolatopsis japonica]|uniref:Lsr2 dimerization domain-containing protein n=1 Tax=Amycolatopsis japonica TaxID=208439 RepID=UPI00366AA7EF
MTPTGEPERTTALETVSFSLDDIDYEIDLPGEHAMILRQILERYIRAGRRRPGNYFSPEW